MCWRLHKALYGLKQAPRAWYAKLRAALEELGYRATAADPALFVRKRGSGGAQQLEFMLVYVDDLLVAGSKHDVQCAKQAVLMRFKGRDLGEAGVYLGLHIERDRAAGTLKVSQPAYTAQVLTKHSMEEAKSRSTPMDAGSKLSWEGGAELEGSERTRYAALVGSLLYLANCTRPDVAHSTSMLARFMSAPGQQHMQAAKGVLRYLAGSMGEGIVFSQQHGGALVGWGDADYAGCADTKRSTSGYVFVRAGGAVSWSSKRQSVVALSTAEAEYISAAALVREALWLQQLERDMRLAGAGQTTLLYTDNQAALALLRGAMGSRRVKHVDVPYHFAREKVQEGKVCFVYCPSSEMAADMLTKAVSAPMLQKCKDKVGIK